MECFNEGGNVDLHTSEGTIESVYFLGLVENRILFWESYLTVASQASLKSLAKTNDDDGCEFIKLSATKLCRANDSCAVFKRLNVSRS